MGWGSGAEVFSGVIKAAIKYFPEAEKRKEFYSEVYPAFANHDWDTESDCFQDDPVFEEWYCNISGTLPQRKQQEIAIQIFNDGIQKEAVEEMPDIVALNLEDKKAVKNIVEEIWYYVEEIQEDGVDSFYKQYELR